MHTCILGIVKKLWVQCVMLVYADQKLADGAVHLNTVVANAELHPRALCMRMPTWTRTITASHSQASSWLCALLKCASQGTICFSSHRRHPFMGCMLQHGSCMTVMNSGQIMWHDAHLQIARLQDFCLTDCMWLLAKRRRFVHECKEAPVCRHASDAIATCPSTSNKRQGRGW